MKSKVKFIIAIAIMQVSMIACGQDNTNSLTVNRDSIRASNAILYLYDWERDEMSNTVVTGNNFDGNYIDELENFTNPVVRIQNGRLTINLGTPNNLRLLRDYNYPVNDTSARGFRFGGEFLNYANESIILCFDQDGNDVLFLYADRNVTINGTWRAGSGRFIMDHIFQNISLQQGWNIIIATGDFQNNRSIYRNARPDTNIRWAVLRE
jgi:hypothetical protein